MNNNYPGEHLPAKVWMDIWYDLRNKVYAEVLPAADFPVFNVHGEIRQITYDQIQMPIISQLFQCFIL